jgi:hypothetical protein
MENEPKEEGDFWPVFKIPDFVPSCRVRDGVYLSLDQVGFLRAEGALWSVTPPEDILPRNFGNFPFGHLFLPGYQVHVCLQVDAFPVQVPAAPGVLRGGVLPIVSYCCQACSYSLGAYVSSPVLSVQN